MREDPYQGIARWYDRLFEPLNAKLRAIGLALAELNAGQSVLDVGCGTGSLLAIWRTRGCVVHGIDKSAAMLNVARRKLGDAARLYVGDATRMPFDDAEFDRVTAMLTLHEMRQPERLSVLREMRRVLKSEGRIILIDFHPGPLDPIPGVVGQSRHSDCGTRSREGAFSQFP